MPKVNSETIILAIQLIQEKLRLIKDTPENEITEGDEILYYECQRAAINLKEVYQEFEKDNLNFPPYSRLAPEDL